jgi:hypothetical protein
MGGTQRVRMVWLKALYWYTLLGAGSIGLWILLAPTTFATAFAMPSQDPFILGVAGSTWLAFAFAAGLGLRSPLAFAPIFLVQLGYKVLWLVAVFLPRVLRGPLPAYSWVLVVVFASFIVLDLVAVPFRRLAER